MQPMEASFGKKAIPWFALKELQVATDEVL